jgi:uncharacterized protein (DUF58 family)
MPKRAFWPAAMIVIGAILIATRLQLLPTQLWNLWPIVLIIVGLGGLLISDTEEWDAPKSKSVTTSVKKTTKKVSTKKTTRRKK